MKFSICILYTCILINNSLCLSRNSIKNPENDKDVKDLDFLPYHEHIFMSFAFPKCLAIGRDAIPALLKAYWDGIDVPEVLADFIAPYYDFRNMYPWKRAYQILRVRLGLGFELGDFSKYVTSDGQLYKQNHEYMQRLQRAGSISALVDRLSSAGEGAFITSPHNAMVDAFIGGKISSIARLIIQIAITNTLMNNITNRYQELIKNGKNIIDNRECSGSRNNKLSDFGLRRFRRRYKKLKK